MAARVACMPRVCLSCRLGLQQQRALPGIRHVAPSDRHRQRRYASDNLGRQMKERVEAMILGKEYDDPKVPQKSKKASSRRPKAQKRLARKDELPDWGFTSRDKKPTQSASRKEKLSRRTFRKEQSPEAASRKERPPEPTFRSVDWGDLGGLKEHKTEPVKTEPLDDGDAGKQETEENRLDTSLSEANETLLERPTKDTSRSDAAMDEHIQETGHPLAEDAHLEKPFAFHHELLHHEHLGVDALGKPIDALVINNPNKLSSRSRASPSTLEEQEAPPDLKLDWKSLLPTSQSQLDAETEVTRHIEELRPKDTTTLRDEDFHHRLDALAHRFTKNQLQGYFDEHGTDAKKPIGIPAYTWLAEQAEWKAFGSKKGGKRYPSAKHRLAHLILTSTWNLEVEPGEVGSASLLFQKKVYPHIQRVFASQPWMTTLLDASSHETITIVPGEHRLDLHVRKATLVTLLSKMDEFVQSIQYRKVTIQSPRYQIPDGPSIAELARITNTSIQSSKAQDGTDLEISWIPEMGNSDAVKDQIESPADFVLRLLLVPSSAFARKRKNHKLTFYEDARDPKREGVVVPYARNKASMSWSDAVGSWGRLVLPTAKPVEGAKQLSKDRKAITIVDAMVFDLEDVTTRVVTATFGHLLQKMSGEKGPLRLASVAPHPFTLSAISKVQTGPEYLKKREPKRRTTIVANFIAGSQYGTPDLRLRMPVDDRQNLSRFSMPSRSSLSAILPVAVHNFQCPGESVDARVTMDEVIPLDISQSRLQEFFAASKIDLSEGRLQAPVETTISIPRRILEMDKSAEGEVDTQYYFAGFEIHITTAVRWGRHTLLYNSIEAGHRGGRRQELSLVEKHLPADRARGRRRRIPRSPWGRRKHQVSPTSLTRRHLFSRPFINLVGEVIRGEHFSWTQGEPHKDEAYLGQQQRLAEEANHPQEQSATGVENVKTSDPAEDSEFFDLEENPSEVSALSISIAGEGEELLENSRTLAAAVEEALQPIQAVDADLPQPGEATAESAEDARAIQEGVGDSSILASTTNQGEDLLNTGRAIAESIEDALKTETEREP